MSKKTNDYSDLIASSMAETLADKGFQKIFHRETSPEQTQQSPDLDQDSFESLASDSSCAKDKGSKCKCKCTDCKCGKGESKCKDCGCKCAKKHASALKHIAQLMTKISAVLDEMGLEVGAEETLKVLNGLEYEFRLNKEAGHTEEEKEEDKLEVSDEDEDEGEDKEEEAEEKEEKEEKHEKTEEHEELEELEELEGEEEEEEKLIKELESRITDLVGDEEKADDSEGCMEDDDAPQSEEEPEHDESTMLHCKFCNKFEVPSVYMKKGKEKQGFKKLLEHVHSAHPKQYYKLENWISKTSPKLPPRELEEPKEKAPESHQDWYMEPGEELELGEASDGHTISPAPQLREALRELKEWLKMGND